MIRGLKFEDIKNKKVAILGFGKEGKSTLNFLISIGVKDISILDENKSNLLSINQLEDLFNKKNKCLNLIKFVSGEDYLKNLGIYDIIIKSPGISLYKKEIYPLKDKLVSQTSIFLDNYSGKVIGITGTKGKSTTSTLLYNILKDLGYKTKLVGNIGKPVFDQFQIKNGDFEKKEDFVVYELSSYMLEDFEPSLFMGILVNIYKDHLDWHKNFLNYKKAKLNISLNSKYFLVNNNFSNFFNDNKEFFTFGESGDLYYKAKKFYKKDKLIFDDSNIKLNGTHNMINISGVLLALDLISSFLRKDLDLEVVKKTLGKFGGLPHRQENLGVFSGITFIDDAISTTPESTIEAIKTFGKDAETIFLGGTDRGYDFLSLIDYIKKSNIKNIVLFPDSGKRIFDLIKDLEFNILETTSMKEAVKFAFENTSKTKICLLSTASPSYSLWKNFEEKGSEFKKEIILYFENSKNIKNKNLDN